MEAIINDDLKAFQRIPKELNNSYKYTLYEFVFDSLLADNPTLYDSVVLFHSTHANIGANALDAAYLYAGRVAMMSQTRKNNAKTIPLVPKWLIVPLELEKTALELTTPAKLLPAYPTTGNVLAERYAFEVITIPHWTDANNWFLFCDTNICPCIEIGFLNGRQEPEIFVQDQPNVGSMFTNDKLTYKIRNWWGGVNVDYRGAFGAIVT